MKPSQKSAPALQAPHNSGERVQNGDTALAGADTPSSVSTPADATALANCPFCGGHARLYQRQNAAALWHVACENCDAGPHSDLGKYEAIARWNTRATSQTPDAVRNWTEDASHENGNYECRCVECSQMFIGHKRRVLCKACSGLLTPSASAGPQAAAEIERLREWKASVLSKCKHSDGFDSLKWAGDKEGWGFAHYFIGHLETRALHAESILAEQDAQPQQVDGRDAVIEALKPFAKAADAWDSPSDTWEDTDALDPKDKRNKLLTVGDLRRARAALQQSPATDSAADQRAHLRDAERVSATDSAPAVGAHQRQDGAK